MKVLWILIAVAGVWFLASAATDEGLLPSGMGRDDGPRSSSALHSLDIQRFGFGGGGVLSGNSLTGHLLVKTCQ